VADGEEFGDGDAAVDVVEEEGVGAAGAGTGRDEGDVVGEAERPGFTVYCELHSGVIQDRLTFILLLISRRRASGGYCTS